MKFIIFLYLLTSILLFSKERMPGEYLRGKEVHELLNDIDFQGDFKNGNYEIYSVVNSDLEFNEMKFSIFDDESKTLKWLEVSLTSNDNSVVVSKMLTTKKLMEGKLKRIQIKFDKYYPFELDLTKNKKIDENVTKSFLKRKTKTLIKEQKFLRDDTIKISGKTYKIKVYQIKKQNKDIEYALLDPKDVKVLGLAYFKQKNGTNLYLKDLGDNSLSVFPKEVPMLDFINKISEMSEGFLKEKESRKKALEREKKLEKEDEIDKDNPIEKLNKMLEKEGK